jgi:putative phosphoesterase
MKNIIGVISDTHMNGTDQDLEFLNGTVFRDASEIIHCGDIVVPEVLDAFADKSVIAVSGNMDGYEVRKLFPFIEKKRFCGIDFLILHGEGCGLDIFSSLKNEFPDFSAFLYGHTHKPLINKVGKYVFFNPGSFSHNRIKEPSRSVGIIELDDEKASFKIIDLGEISQKKFKIKEVLDVRYSKGNFF